MTQQLHQEPLVGEYTPLSQTGIPETTQTEAHDSSTAPSRSWSEALRDLPRQYIKVFRRPSAMAFAQEIANVRWDMVWFQLGGVAVLEVVFLLLASLLPSLHAFTYPSAIPLLNNPFISLVTIPLQFFVQMGLFYLLARAMGGKGTFLAQSYTSLLIYVPANVLTVSLSLTLGLIPVAGGVLFGLLNLALGIYQIVLQVYALMAVHRLSGGKATSIVILLILFFALVGGLFGTLVAQLH